MGIQRVTVVLDDEDVDWLQTQVATRLQSSSTEDIKEMLKRGDRVGVSSVVRELVRDARSRGTAATAAADVHRAASTGSTEAARKPR